MKKIFIYAAVLFGICSFTSCDNNIADEQFTKMVLLTKNGVQDYNIEFTGEGQVELKLPISINGTSKNDRDVTVRLIEDADTLKVSVIVQLYIMYFHRKKCILFRQDQR